MTSSLGIESIHGDGNDVLESRKILSRIFNEVKNGRKATWFVEFDTYRWREHCGYQFDNNIGYRSLFKLLNTI